MLQQLTVTVDDVDDLPEPNLVRAMSPFLSPSTKHTVSVSDIFDNKKAKFLAETVNHEMQSKSAFPEKYQYCGYLAMRTADEQPLKRQYFVLSNNFLFGGDTIYSTKLSVCISLEGTTHIRSTDMTFDLKQYSFRAHSPSVCREWIQHIERASTLTIYDLYRFRYELGNSSSSNAKVIASKHRVSNREFAIKIMNKKKCNDRKTLVREIQILKKLRSPYLVELSDLFESSKYLYIVMELCAGGELFDQIASMDYLNGDHYTERDIIGIMQQLASGVQYMHDMGIVHRDLKPENILCVEPNSIKKIKISDFGISAIMDSSRQQKGATTPTTNSSTKSHHHMASSSSGSVAAEFYNMTQNSMMRTRVGTLSYTAPEILKYRPYDEKVDYWSLGVIMYILVCGYPPFDADDDYELSDVIISDEVEFDDEDWTHVGKETRTLIGRLLDKNPRKRANCEDIIEHSWKIDVQNAGFMRAHHKFKQTVFKRKVKSRTRANTPDGDERVQQLQSRMEALRQLNIQSLDDSNLKFVRRPQRMSPAPAAVASKGSVAAQSHSQLLCHRERMNIIQFDAQQKEAQISAWTVGGVGVGAAGHEKQKSKTTEFLGLENDAMFVTDNVEDVLGAAEDLPDLPSFDLMSYSNRASLAQINMSRKGTDVTDCTDVSDSGALTPNTGTRAWARHAYQGSTHSRLSVLSSKSFLDSFNNKRRSITKYRRSKPPAHKRSHSKQASTSNIKRKSSARDSQHRYGQTLDIDEVPLGGGHHTSSYSTDSLCDTIDDESDAKMSILVEQQERWQQQNKQTSFFAADYKISSDVKLKPIQIRFDQAGDVDEGFDDEYEEKLPQIPEPVHSNHAYRAHVRSQYSNLSTPAEFSMFEVSESGSPTENEVNLSSLHHHNTLKTYVATLPSVASAPADLYPMLSIETDGSALRFEASRSSENNMV
eukprot:CAMPEP_0202730048 /NCGR_PEP_ID=MMETSP1385-20130828/186445_1 /ASSEMBLY_ACC=CAM_ASM_000861 /TAXON_ID=933848 /ORGANISM="Elphidium margaritaceum" /LENGTH=936 /DNA_ID=CAMNT_0049396321 /DNA_START=47 /DNA_END=2857 /DNA_ORIENTATION=+